MDTRYKNALMNIPAPGCGCHNAMMSVANHGVSAGIQSTRLFYDIRGAIPQGNRHVPDKEITEAINKALLDHGKGTFTPKPRKNPLVKDGKTALQRIIDQGRYSTDAELLKASPIAIPDETERHTKLFIETLYRHDDFLFIGERHDVAVKDAVDWLTFFIEGGKTAPHIIINPLSGLSAPTKAGDKETFRGDLCVKAFRYCLVEFDNLSREDQIRFFSAVKLPIVALIDSGNKSIHGLLQVSKMVVVDSLARWDIEIKENLYRQRLVPMGVDSACSNPARLSRLPGHYREEKQAWQRLLWLSPEGMSLCHTRL